MIQTTTHRAASDARESSAYSDHISEELHRYEEHLRDVRGLVEAYCRQQARIVGRFLHKKFADRPINITELIAEDVRRFLANQLDALRTPSNALQLASALRSYFRYRATCGDQVDKLTAAVSSPAHWKLASLPRAQARRSRTLTEFLHCQLAISETWLRNCALRIRHGIEGWRNRSSHDQRH